VHVRITLCLDFYRPRAAWFAGSNTIGSAAVRNGQPWAVCLSEIPRYLFSWWWRSFAVSKNRAKTVEMRWRRGIERFGIRMCYAERSGMRD